jgi:HPt (histidine-containing phosphotransfer) domain-containing protein
MAHRKNSLSPSLFDLNSALERTGGDEAFLRELLVLYNDEFKTKLPELKSAWKAKNYQEIKEISHSLKGASANLSLLSLQKICWELEQAGKDEDEDKIKSLLTKLEKEYEKVKLHLQQEGFNFD